MSENPLTDLTRPVNCREASSPTKKIYHLSADLQSCSKCCCNFLLQNDFAIHQKAINNGEKRFCGPKSTSYACKESTTQLFGRFAMWFLVSLVISFYEVIKIIFYSFNKTSRKGWEYSMFAVVTLINNTSTEMSNSHILTRSHVT